MPSEDVKAFGVEIWADGDDARSMDFDANVRGFTGLIVGLLLGIATWGLIFIVWWLA